MKLIYRGQTYNLQTAPAIASLRTPSTLTQALIYRGHAYLFKPAVPCSTRLPRRFNWRYSVPCEAALEQLNPAH